MSDQDGARPDEQRLAGPTSVPLLHKFLYGLAYVPVGLSTIMVMTWIGMRYYPPETATAASVALATEGAVAAALILGRVVDAIADPLLGYWSDRLRTRWGRRKPFILVGGPLLAVTFVLIWTPPVPALSAINAVYLGITASAFFFAFTVVVCPYLAMLPEITPDPAERVSLGAWQGGFNVLGTVGGMALTGYLVHSYGYRTMALVWAPVILLCAWAPLLVPTPVAAEEPSALPLRRAVASTFSNPWFPPYVISQLLFWLALSIVLMAGLQLPVARARVDEAVAGLPLAAALLVAGLLFPVMRTLAERVSKRRLLMGAMVWLGLMMVPLIFAGLLPLPLTAFQQMFLVMALAGPSVAALFALPNPMVGDIVDHDEELTGQRREAIYFGVQGLLVKAGTGVGAGIAVLLLGLFGNDATRQGGFIACPLVAMVLAWVAAAVLTRYRGD